MKSKKGDDRMKKKQNTPMTGDPFLDSLYDYAPTRAEVAYKPKKKWSAKLFRLGALVVCFAVLVVSVTSILKSVVGYQEAGDFYDRLSGLWDGEVDPDGNIFGRLSMGVKDSRYKATVDYEDAQNVSNDNQTIEDVEADSETLNFIKARLSALRQQNDDLVGWISIPDTRIDYPVVLTTDNEYYLNHAFDRTYLAAGTIFIDYRNTNDLSENRNTVIYGHNMLSGAMFSCISDFFSRSYFNENRLIYIYTDEGIYVYKTFNIYKVKINKDVSYIKTRFESGEEFVEFCNKMKSYSAVKVDDIEFNENDRIITLSTCTNSHNDNERYCLQAKLIEIQK